MRKYTIFKTNGVPDWSAVPAISVDCILWEPDCSVRMVQQLCYDETALYVRQRAKESAVRAEYTAPLSPVHQDSCMEFFFALGDDERYFNFEINPNACFELGFGPNRQNRIRLCHKNEQEAFDRFLSTQGPAYVPTGWPELADAIALISRAGGVPVLAHPLRYRFNSDLAGDALVEAFVTAGGKAIEVTSGSQVPQCSTRCAAWARKYGLFASTGSDFHRITTARPMLGHQPELPADLRCVTELLDLPKL